MGKVSALQCFSVSGLLARVGLCVSGQVRMEQGAGSGGQGVRSKEQNLNIYFCKERRPFRRLKPSGLLKLLTE